jgi:hypothetical protein
MSKPITTEIYRQDGENFRSIMLTLEPNGTIMVDTQDMGPLVQQVFGDSDYEFWIRVPPRSRRPPRLRAPQETLRRPRPRRGRSPRLLHR